MPFQKFKSHRHSLKAENKATQYCCWRTLSIVVYVASLVAQLVKNPPCNAGDPSSIPGLGRATGEGIGYPLQYSWASLVTQLVKICLQCRRPWFDPWVGKISWRRERLPTPVFRSGEFHVYSPWGHKELDTTERLSLHFTSYISVIAMFYLHW